MYEAWSVCDKTQLHVVDVLNSGTYGKVFKVQMVRKAPTVVALKTFFKRPQDPQLPTVRIDDVRRELDTWSSFRHPHIVPAFLQLDLANGQQSVHFGAQNTDLEAFSQLHGVLPLGVTCEFAPYGELFEKIPLSIPKATEYIAQIASAVVYMHRKGFYHGDIKPENIVFTGPEFCKLTDFGFSGQISSDVRLNRGSIGYSHPGIFFNAPPPAVHNDVYALGATLFTIVKQAQMYEIKNKSWVYSVEYTRIRRCPVAPFEKVVVASTVSDGYNTSGEMYDALIACRKDSPDCSK